MKVITSNQIKIIKKNNNNVGKRRKIATIPVKKRIKKKLSKEGSRIVEFSSFNASDKNEVLDFQKFANNYVGANPSLTPKWKTPLDEDGIAIIQDGTKSETIKAYEQIGNIYEKIKKKVIREGVRAGVSAVREGVRAGVSAVGIISKGRSEIIKNSIKPENKMHEEDKKKTETKLSKLAIASIFGVSLIALSGIIYLIIKSK